MSCNGIGQYLIAIAASTGQFSFYEIFAWENKLLEADVTSLAFTGMTPSHTGGQTLFGISDPEQTELDMALSGSEHKITFNLQAEDVVMYVFFVAKGRSTYKMRYCTTINVKATDSVGTIHPCSDIDWAT